MKNTDQPKRVRILAILLKTSLLLGVLLMWNSCGSTNSGGSGGHGDLTDGEHSYEITISGGDTYSGKIDALSDDSNHSAATTYVSSEGEEVISLIITDGNIRVTGFFPLNSNNQPGPISNEPGSTGSVLVITIGDISYTCISGSAVLSDLDLNLIAGLPSGFPSYVMNFEGTFRNVDGSNEVTITGTFGMDKTLLGGGFF